MGKLWNFLNSPLIVVLVALSIWPILLALTSAYSMKIGIQEMAGAIGSEVVAPFKKMGQQQDEKLKKELNIIDNIAVSNVKFVPSDWKNRQKVIGQLTNKSDATAKTIKVIVSYYAKDKGLIDVGNEWLSSIKALRPGETTSFTMNRSVGEQGPADKVEIKIGDLTLVE